jgi:hypothetical protein
MKNNVTIKFADLSTTDLIVDAVYEGGAKGNSSDDPLAKLLKVSNQGGFRYIGNVLKNDIRATVLYSSMDDVDWPDSLDDETGIFHYYGDNKKPGRELHATPRKGNLLLKQIFDNVHSGNEGRAKIPITFVFTKAGKGRDVIFKGVAIPGAESVPSTEDLVAVWKTYAGSRFQNYRAIFTILDIPKIKREWIADILEGNLLSVNCPQEWRSWVKGGIAMPLKAPRVLEYRSRSEQLPQSKEGEKMLKMVKDYFEDDPFQFEKFVAELLKIADKNIANIEVTRPRKDGGRDAIGLYKLQIGREGIFIDFAVEAKCYGLKNSVGVKEMSRLISRLRHRQFGLLVTTSYVADQAYKEIREDGHPIVVISGGDIVDILISKGISTKVALQGLLNSFGN